MSFFARQRNSMLVADDQENARHFRRTAATNTISTAMSNAIGIIYKENLTAT